MNKIGIKKNIAVIIFILLIMINISTCTNGRNISCGSLKNSSFGVSSSETMLDIQFIYNITAALSNIVFTEYDEKHGEIAKGRAFGTKGEHKAAEILYENMSKLGLYTIKEQIKPRYPSDWVSKKVEILDYKLVLNNGSNKLFVDCAPQIPMLSRMPFVYTSKSKLVCNFSGLKIRKNYPKSWENTEDYVLLRNESVQNYTYNGRTILDFIKKGITSYINRGFLSASKRHPHCKGEIVYYVDGDNDTHDVTYFGTLGFPRFYINKTIGTMMEENIGNLTVDLYLKQRINRSVESYNVIGQLNGSDPTKTVIVCCLYDSMWCQGTGDSAIGMAIVLGIAKYFVEHNLTPKYNLKFIGFGGEEYTCRGSYYYESKHLTERIVYVIDLNQLGFTQEQPRLRLEVVANSQSFLDEIWKVVERTDYISRTGNTTGIVKIFSPAGHLSDDAVFAVKRPYFLPFHGCKTVCFLKNGKWLFHHRDGLNHTEGDVLKYFNWTDVEVTGEIILNVTKYLTVGNTLDNPVDFNYSGFNGFFTLYPYKVSIFDEIRDR